jgi:hypothetical protein
VFMIDAGVVLYQITLQSRVPARQRSR